MFANWLPRDPVKLVSTVLICPMLVLSKYSFPKLRYRFKRLFRRLEVSFLDWYEMIIALKNLNVFFRTAAKNMINIKNTKIEKLRLANTFGYFCIITFKTGSFSAKLKSDSIMPFARGTRSPTLRPSKNAVMKDNIPGIIRKYGFMSIFRRNFRSLAKDE
jgi:hypothetical protein